MNKNVKIVLIGLVGVVAFTICMIIMLSSKKHELPLISTLDMSIPQQVTGGTAQVGEYQGERNTTVDGKQQTKLLKDIDTSEFHIYSYNSTPTVKGKSSNLWIENRDINTYSTQTLIVDTDTKEVVYISPIMDPGTYVEEQKLLTSKVETTKSYEIITYLYTKSAESYELYSVGVASVTFAKNK